MYTREKLIQCSKRWNIVGKSSFAQKMSGTFYIKKGSDNFKFQACLFLEFDKNIILKNRKWVGGLSGCDGWVDVWLGMLAGFGWVNEF